jgi:hypothetical protein
MPPEVLHHLIGESTQVANAAHDRIDGVVKFTKLHLVATVVAVVLAVGTLAGGMLSLMGFQKALDKADVRMAAADTRNEEYTKQAQLVQQQLASAQAQITALSAAQTQRQQVIVVRDQAAATRIAEVTRPNVTAAQAFKDMTDNSVVTPASLATLLPDNTIAIEPLGIQEITTTKIQRDQLRLDLTDTQSNLVDEQTKFDASQVGLKDVTALNAQCETDKAGYVAAAKAYRKVAVKSKWKRFLGGAEKVLLVAGGITVGMRL